MGMIPGVGGVPPTGEAEHPQDSRHIDRGHLRNIHRDASSCSCQPFGYWVEA
jgi:hypothetical protein